MVNVDTVYKTVLYILNKEQRGYITPDEFSRLGVQVQREIFEQYFEELNQQLRVPQTDNEYANRVKNLEEKIDIFKTFSTNIGYDVAATNFSLPSNLHRLGTLVYGEKEIQGVNRNEYFLINKSPLTAPTTSNPLYILEGTGSPSAAPSIVYVYPNSITSGVDAYYVKTPLNPRWGYYLGSAGQYIYDSTVYGANLLNTGTGTLTSSANLTTQTATNGTYSLVQGATPADFTVAPAGGTGLQLEIVVTGVAPVTLLNNTSINITTAGSGYSVGDQITIPTTAITGLTAPIIITLTAANFNANSTYGSTQFELHNSEQTNIILNILMYAGVIIRDPQIVQTAARMVQQDEALEKQ